jgi:phage shock protein PspC (stress-responsive transcriptional regulator)
MKKIININFHGRVIPIEETAYDILKQYVESLRKHFANEEGRDEIINDIENRFAELFSERLTKGSTCITDDDVNAIIQSMGRPEDFDTDDMGHNGGASQEQGKYSEQRQQHYAYEDSRQLFRSENDKVLGGVCAGIAHYLKIDPAIMRIIFVLITFGGFGLGILIYFLLWIFLPPRSMVQNVRKRLYRNPDNRVLGGVASGLAAYFHIEVWIPRLIFALPLILGIVTSIFRRPWFDMDPTPVFFTGGFGGTLFITYIILWMVLPEANTASEKLEMRGEKVDLESIKNTIKSDLEGFKGRASNIGTEMKEKAQQMGKEFGQAGQRFAAEAGPTVRKTGTSIGHAIGILFKAFFLFIAGIIAIALISVLIGLLFTGAGVLPFRHYILAGFWQNFFAWSTLILFVGVPIVGLLTWLVRRIIGARSKNNYLGYMFGSLWTLGWVAVIVFISMMANNFRTRSSVDDELNLIQPSNGKMIVKVDEAKVSYYGSDWFGFDWDNNGPFYSLNEDSVMMTTVRVNLVKSQDTAYHIHRVRFSHGNNPGVAKDLASRIQFNVHQSDSLLYLPAGFAITPEEKFRNQQVLVVVEIPVGKRIVVDRNIDDYHWFSININRRRSHWNWEFDDDWSSTYSWSSNVEYVMTENGLERTERTNQEYNEDNSGSKSRSPRGYRYKNKADSINAKGKVDSTAHRPTPSKKEANSRSASEQNAGPDDDEKLTLLPMHASLFM